MLKFFNTLSGRVEEFHPLHEGEARLYICGPTVWDYAHIGNFRTMAAFGDTLRRYLKYKGYKVTHVMNITDIEDRIIKFSAERGQTIDEYTGKYTEAFLDDYEALGAERPEVLPRATRHIDEMVEIIKRLRDVGPRLRVRRLLLLPHRLLPRVRQALEDQLRGQPRRRERARRHRQVREGGRARLRALEGAKARPTSPRGTRRSARAGPAGTSSAPRCR